jgi:hypothetical protein
MAHDLTQPLRDPAERVAELLAVNGEGSKLRAICDLSPNERSII